MSNHRSMSFWQVENGIYPPVSRQTKSLIWNRFANCEILTYSFITATVYEVKFKLYLNYMKEMCNNLNKAIHVLFVGVVLKLNVIEDETDAPVHCCIIQIVIHRTKHKRTAKRISVQNHV